MALALLALLVLVAVQTLEPVEAARVFVATPYGAPESAPRTRSKLWTKCQPVCEGERCETRCKNVYIRGKY